jgi:hypothetical protein
VSTVFILVLGHILFYQRNKRDVHYIITFYETK